MLSCLLLASLAISSRTARAQYPAGPQIAKDGTTVLLQNYASLPLSSRTSDACRPPISST